MGIRRVEGLCWGEYTRGGNQIKQETTMCNWEKDIDSRMADLFDSCRHSVSYEEEKKGKNIRGGGWWAKKKIQ